MICWSCEKRAGAGVLCEACGAVQPPEASLDHFQVLGLPRRFALDLDEAERRYKELTRVLHPDRYARADARARRASLARSVQLNEAWRTLRDPVRRAEYLLSLAGVEVGGEEGTVRHGEGRKERVPVPQALLLEVLELREALSAVHGDRAAVDRLAAGVRARREEALGRAVAALERDQVAPAADALVAVRYFDRFLAEAAASEEAAHAG
jgi:molecular chaperone HscB